LRTYKKFKKLNNNIVQIQSELIKAGGRAFSSEIHKSITFVSNNEELPEE
jgi:hypothetical protein